MRTVVRWLVAVLATIATFALATWVSGALVLTHVMKDAGVRWGVAGALGVAVAALAALWGHSFATREQSAELTRRSGPHAAYEVTRTGSGDTRNKISGGTFHESAIQGRDISVSHSTGYARPADLKPEGQ